MAVPDAFGVYIHIPFCAARCDYCAFATWTDRDHLIDRYVDALTGDIGRSFADGLPEATSIFVGGGTPSAIPAESLASVIAAVPRRTDDIEVTVECNPDDVDADMLATYSSAGVNRISLGVQSMVPEVLATLGRSHQPDNVARAVEAIRDSGIESFNLDLIYGAADETITQWRSTLESIVALNPTHVSAYALSVEPGTPLAQDPDRYPDDDDQADKYEIADEVLSNVGLLNYEISNWARPGAECQHNLLYWRQGDYQGFGCAAHSHRSGRRSWNVRTPDRYIRAVEAGESTEAAAETLDDAARLQERLELAIRTRDGVPSSAIEADGLGDLVERAGDRWTLSRRGRLLANEVSVRLRSDGEDAAALGSW